MSYDNTAEVQEETAEVVEITKPKRERKPKLDAEGQPIVKAARTPKEPKAPKLYPQYNEDGSPLLDSEGQPVMLETRMKKPKAPAAPRKTAVVFSINGTPTAIKDLMEATITIVGDIGSREGSKRADRVKAFEGAATVADFVAAGGVNKDLARLSLLKRIELRVGDELVEVASA